MAKIIVAEFQVILIAHRILGQNWNSMAPGLDFVFGRQPDSNWLNEKAANGLITRDTTLNYMFRQSLDQKLSITAQLEPIREFTIDLNVDKTYTKDYSELFKTITENGKFRTSKSTWQPEVLMFLISHLKLCSLKTNRQKFHKLSENLKLIRLILSERLALSNPYQKGDRNQDGLLCRL